MSYHIEKDVGQTPGYRITAKFALAAVSPVLTGVESLKSVFEAFDLFEQSGKSAR